ncbi:hypothetical protein KC19_3G013200 [Ceratodon purpureus]|uniref:3-dehydroquinate synthase C-terminal domain-containing protein n=1 Tax=Ceratodon purpureus TaxID=3225 RepID=A0A8T0IDM7_CERPU|nr:hypothetical protein KC19_3G013200 [Ceratodon purpureus]
MIGRVERLGVSTTEKKGNMSRVVSVESPYSRDGFTSSAETMAGYHSTELGIEKEGSTLRVVTQSPMDALRMGMASPFRNFLGLLKPPALPGSSLHGSDESPRASNISAAEIENLCLGALKLTLGAGAEKDVGAEMTSSSVASRLYETRPDGQSLVMVAFDANVKEVSHAGIVWAMDHVLKRGDILAVVSVLDSVRGPLGYRVKVGDQKWLNANQKLVEEEIQQRMEVWRNFPGLENRCTEGGVKLVVMVKAAQRGELAICREAVKLGACHVVLDKSLKNRRREFYLQNLSCDVTRMRRSGGVDVIRPNLDIAAMMGLVQRNMTLPSVALEPPSPTSVIPPALLSYGDQIDVFEISLGAPKAKRVNSHTPKSSPIAPPLPSPKYSGGHSSSAYSGESKSGELRHHSSSGNSGELKSGELRHHPVSAFSGELKFGELRHHSGSAYSGELKSGELRRHSGSAYSGELRKNPGSAYSGELKSGELRRLSSSAVLASSYDRSSSMSLSTSTHARSSSVSAAPSAQASLTSSSNATDNDMDDDLFSIFHGSTRHTEIDTDLFNNINPPLTSGYESDDLFSICNGSTQRASPAPVLALEYHHSHSHSQPLLRPGHYPIPNSPILKTNPQLSLEYTPTTQSSSRELVISEPLREATISRVTFVVGLGEAVTLSLHHPLSPGEGLLVGSSPSALFLMHSGHHHATTTLSTATPGSYIAMEGKMAMKLAFLEPDQRVLAVDSLGRCRTIPVRHATTTATPLVLVEAQCEGRRHSTMLHHTDSVGLCHSHGHGHRHGENMGTMVSVKSLKVGDRVLLRLRSAEPSHAIWSS